MRALRTWSDTIARRMLLTVILAILATLLLNLLLSRVFNTWERLSLQESGLLEQAAFIIRLMDANPAATRPAIAAAATSAGDILVDWYPHQVPVAPAPDNQGESEVRDSLRSTLNDPGRTILVFNSRTASASSPGLIYDRSRYPDARFLACPLSDGSWLVFTATHRTWGLPHAMHRLFNAAFLILSAIVVSAIANRQLGRPFQQFAAAASHFDGSGKFKPITERGPRELRAAIQAFNAMLARIQRYVADETNMLAAISHDLRVPLTRIRLRAEFVEDAEQQARLFRDVDAMEAMLASALTFLQDNSGQERVTTIDLSELLLTIVEDFSDQGYAASFGGPDHVALHGRPIALTRAFTNLVDNAIKYGGSARITLAVSGHTASIGVQDHGPGIADDQIEAAFAPFVRLDTSRSPTTGGVGLGLAAARAVCRMHGGDVVLSNAPGGGLLALVTIPLGET